MLSKDARLRLFLDRLRSATPAANHEEAFALIATTLNMIEDENSGVPANPSNWQSDGRMYPPQTDMARPSSDLPGVTIYRSRGHRTLIGANGAFTIAEIHGGKVLVEKVGADGRGLPKSAPPKGA